MNVMETTGANMAARISWVAIDVAAHKGTFNIISGISVLMKMNVPTLVLVVLLPATTHSAVTSALVHLDFLMTSSLVHAMT